MSLKIRQAAYVLTCRRDALLDPVAPAPRVDLPWRRLVIDPGSGSPGGVDPALKNRWKTPAR